MINKMWWLVVVVSFLISCTSKQEDAISTGVLKKFFDVYDVKNSNEFHLTKTIDKLNGFYSSNNAEGITKTIAEIGVIHTKFLESMRKSFPSGQISIPFVQDKNKAFILKRIEIKDFYFPWNTAPILAFEITIKYDLLQLDIRYKSVRLEWYDTEGDILWGQSVSLNKSGETTFILRPERDFRKLDKVIIF